MVFMCLQYKSCENIVGKGEIAHNHLENFLPFSSKLKLSSANSVSLEVCRIYFLGKGYSNDSTCIVNGRKIVER